MSEHTCEEMICTVTHLCCPCGLPAKYHETKFKGKIKWFCENHAPSKIKEREENANLEIDNSHP